MPAQSRAQRRRASTQQPRPASAQPKSYSAPSLVDVVIEPDDSVLVATVPDTVTLQDIPITQAASSSRVVGRLKTRKAPEPVDYTKDYRDVAKDLRLITIWATLLFVAMAALYFAQQANMF